MPRRRQTGKAQMKKVIWGVLSTAKIGRDRVLPGMLKSALLEIRAIGSRDEARGRATANALGIARAYGSYEALLADPEIEAIYNPLPNHLHVPLTLQAAAAGKHVLCEKPIALTADEATQLRAAAGKVLIAEAFMVRFHPQWLRARDLVREGRIGTLRAVQMFFGYNNLDPANVRNKADIGGGGLYDIGCYAIVAGRFFLGAEPTRGIALVDRDPTFRTDRLTSALMDFGDGRRLDFTVSTQIAPHQRLQLCGSKGRIELHIPVNAPQGAATRISIDDCSSLEGTGIVTETLPPSDQYQLQGEAFSRAVRGEIALPYGIEDAIANMRAIDALFRSEQSGRWEDVARN
jgi:predicted dehydrogenase